MQTDGELLTRYARQRDDSAFAELVARHGAMVYRACLRLLGDAHEAEDAAQAAFIVLARKAGSFRPGADLASWLHGIARRAALRTLRDRSRRARHEQEGGGMMRTTTESAPEISEADRRKLLAAVDGELAALPRELRQAVILRYLEGRSQAEAAEIAGCPQGTLGWRASEGLERLRRRLAGRGVTLGAAALTGVLGVEAAATIPQTLVPALAAATKLAAVGAAGGKAVLLADGVVRALLWAKLKIAVAGLAAAAAVAAATPAVVGAVGDRKPVPISAPATPPAPAPADQKEPASATAPADENKPTPELEKALAARLNVVFRRCEVDEVLDELYRQTGMHSTYLKPAEPQKRFTLEQEGVAVREVIEKLAKDAELEFEIRREAVLLWKKLPDAKLAELERRAKEGDVQARCEAFWELGMSGDLRAVAMLQEGIFDVDRTAAFWAQTAWNTSTRQWDAKSLPLWLSVPHPQGFRDRCWKFFSEAKTPTDWRHGLWLLDLSGDPRGIPAAAKALGHRPPPDDRAANMWTAAGYARVTRAPELLKPLMECLDAADALQDVKSCGLWGLSSYEDPAVTTCFRKMLDRQDPRLLQMALSSLETRRDAGEMLDRLDHWMANGGDYWITRSSAICLGYAARRDPQAFSILSGSRAPYAPYGLGLSWNPRAFNLVLARRNEGDPEARGIALRGMGFLRDERSLDLLVAGLKDPEERVRRGAVFGLGVLRDERGLPPLLALAADERPGVRQRAVEALAELGGEKALDVARAAIRDEDRDVVRAGVEALGRLLPDSRRVDLVAERIKTAAPPLRRSLYGALGIASRHPHAMPVLLVGLKDEDGAVRAEVAKQLGYCGDERAIPALIAALDDKFAEVVNAAAEALRPFAPDSPEAAAALKGLGEKEATF